MEKSKYSLRSRVKSFGYAIKGIGSCALTEPNFQIHLLAAVVAITTGALLDISPNEWLWIGLAIALVLGMEMVNTAVEKLTDLISPEENPLAGKAKDIAAGAVLICALFALIVAGIIFLPKLI